jgi:hypothetical protein
MKTHSLSLSYLGAVLILSGCSKDASPTAPRQEGIYGNWNWVKSVGGPGGGAIITPALAGYTQRIALKPDSTYELYQNDTLVGTTRFSIRREKTIFSSDSADVIHFKDSMRFLSQTISLDGVDTLGLGDLVYDGFGHLYTRIK